LKLIRNTKMHVPCLHLAVEVRATGSSVILRSARKLFDDTTHKRIQIGESGQQFFFSPMVISLQW